MQRIEYDMPVLRNSTKEITVRDNTGKEVFTIERFFKNRFQRMLNAIITKFDTNIAVKKEGKLVAESVDFFTLGRHKWNIYDYQTEEAEPIMLEDISKVKTHPRAKFSIDADEYKIEKNFGSLTTNLWKNGSEIVELKFDKWLPPRHIEIHFLEDDDNIPLLLCVLHTYELLY